MVDYSKGKIYKIVCNKTGKIYIGSTTTTLSRRLTQHKLSYRRYLNKKYSFNTSFEIIENENFDIVLIEYVNCSDKNELHQRERYYIENTNCVNKLVPLRTNKEYKNDHVEMYKEYRKKYCEKNNEKIIDYLKNYRVKNKDILNKKKKQYYQNNPEKYKEYRQTNICNCPCGITIQKASKTRHFKTLRHTAYIQSLNNTN